MKFEADGRIFSDEDSAIRYCAEEGISTANITEVSEEEKEEKLEVINEEDLVENPDKDSVITTDEEQEEIKSFRYLVEHWDEISETDKKQFLSVAFGHETGHKQRFKDKTKLVEGKVDGLLKKDIGKPLAQYHLDKMIKSIEYGECPICGEHHSQIQFYEGVDLPQELSFWKPDLKPIKGNPPVFEKQAKAKSPKMFTKEAKIKVTIQHIKSRHPKIYDLIKDLFEKEESERRYDDTEKTDQAQHLSKENLEELSKEELAERISENPELRAKLFRMWKRKLEEREA